MWISFTKKPMNPMIANPIAVAIAIFWNSRKRKIKVKKEKKKSNYRVYIKLFFKYWFYNNNRNTKYLIYFTEEIKSI